MALSREKPTREQVLEYLEKDRNWGRWGDDDQLGAANLITDEKRVEAAGLVKSGRAFSLSREFPKTPGPSNPQPAKHYTYWFDVPWKVEGEGVTGALALDFYGIDYHGFVTTHVDALGHNWDHNGMYNGRDPDEMVKADGIRWADVDQLRDGIVTRGVLIDIPRFRGEPHITQATPVHGWELEEAVAQQGVEMRPGDALCVYMGRASFEAANPEWTPYEFHNPGLHPSCLPFIRQTDAAVLAWDFIDAEPNEYGIPWGVHGSIFAYGVVLCDNCVFESLAAVCAEEQRWEFMLTIAPLRVVGGTGSPVNPIAVM